MKRYLLLVAVFASTICTLFSASIHHKVEFTSDVMSEAIPYTPLLEVGKEWKYNIFHWDVWKPHAEDKECSIKITDCVEIDGEKYYSLEESYNSYDGSYEGDSYDFDNIWLTEDIENKKVYLVSHETFRKELIYDFANPLNTSHLWNIVNLNSKPEYEIYNYGDKQFNSYILGEDSIVRQIEGIGIVHGPTVEPYPYRHNPGNILFPNMSIATDITLPKVYEVVNGDGEVIYSLDSARPGYLTSVEAVSADRETITITETSVEIAGDAAIGSVRVYNTMGSTVRSLNVSDTHCSIPTTDLAPGVYVVQTPNSTRKFVVK